MALLSMCLFFMALATIPVVVLSQKSASRVPRPFSTLVNAVAPKIDPADPAAGALQLPPLPAGAPPPNYAAPDMPYAVGTMMYRPYGAAARSPSPIEPMPFGSGSEAATAVPLGSMANQVAITAASRDRRPSVITVVQNAYEPLSGNSTALASNSAAYSDADRSPVHSANAVQLMMHRGSAPSSPSPPLVYPRKSLY